jgi:hypothetical protein
METPSKQKSIPKFANVVFWIGVIMFLMNVLAIVAGVRFREAGGLIDRANQIALVGLYLLGPTSFISIVVHPKWWAKGISLCLFIYFLFSLLAMRSS